MTDDITATVSLNGGPEVPLALDGLAAPHVRRIDRVTGTLNDDYVDRGNLPSIGDTITLGGRDLECVKIAETQRDDRHVFTVTWCLVE